MRRALRNLLFASSLALLTPVLTLGCNRWQPARAYQIPPGSAGAKPTYDAVQEVLSANKYQVLEKNDAAFSTKIRSHAHESNDALASFIAITVESNGHVVLTPSGYLVRPDGTIHRKLESELEELEYALSQRLNVPLGARQPLPPPAPPPTAATAGTAPSASTSSPTGIPYAWSERAYEPSTWGSDEFTCVPVKIAPEDQSQLRLRLSNGQDATVVISIAYAPELCRSPQQCSLPGGCPALGLGDEQQVAALAGLISNNAVAKEAVLTSRGVPIATLDLSKHGSIAKAMLQLKK
ncbi:MAG: hypothetical protein M3020_18190 [Myxococcota bacterium]|nr:hypothetical protein [Myxococcota bacterium]